MDINVLYNICQKRQILSFRLFGPVDMLKFTVMKHYKNKAETHLFFSKYINFISLTFYGMYSNNLKA